MPLLAKLKGLFVIPFLFSACAFTNSTVPFHEDHLRDSNDAIIYVYRLKSMVGALVPWGVAVDNKIVGSLHQGAYIPLHVPAGRHSLVVGGGRADEKDFFVADAGGVYYYRSDGFGVSFLKGEEALPQLAGMMLDIER